MIVPSAGWAADKSPLMTLELFSGERYMDAELIADIYAIAGDCIETVDLCPVFQDNEEYYYRTDHHWTSLGAYRACNTYMDALQRPFPAEDEFRVERVDGFQGSTYTRSALWSISAEPLELWHGPSELLVSNSDSDTVQDSLFYRQRLEESDKYTVYLDGNHSIVRIDNPAMAGQGKLLVVRDSYCNVLGGFLAESYESVILVDLRYYKNPVSQLYAELGCDSLLVCYSLSNFMTDSNIVWLR